MLKTIGRLLIRWTGRTSYRFGLLIIRAVALVSSHKIKVWPRHSFLNSSFVPGTSDLDVTALCDSPRSLQVFGRRVEKLKSIYPLIGELNAFASSDIATFIHFANPFEVHRDPLLLSQTQFPPRQPTKSDAFLFLLRHLFVDRKNLLMQPKVRLKKWKKHFVDVGLELPMDMNFESIFKAVIVNCPYPLSETEFSIVHSFIASGWSIASKDRTLVLPRLFPRFFANQIQEIALSEEEAELVRAEIRWEIFGIFSQLPLLVSDSGEPQWLRTQVESYIAIGQMQDWNDEVAALKRLLDVTGKLSFNQVHGELYRRISKNLDSPNPGSH